MVHYWKTSLVLAHWVLQPTKILDSYKVRSDKDKERRRSLNEVEYKTDVISDVIHLKFNIPEKFWILGFWRSEGFDFWGAGVLKKDPLNTI